MARVPVTQSSSTRTGFLRAGQITQQKQHDVGAVLQNIGADIGNVAISAAKIEQKTQAAFKKAEDARTLSNEETNATKSLSEFSNGLKSDPDSFETWQTQHNEYVDNTLEDARGRLNPEVFDAFSSSFKKNSTRSFIDITNASRRVLVDKGRSDLDSNLAVYNDLYATQVDPEDRKQILGQASLSISDAQNNGLITEQEAFAKRDEFLQSVEITRLLNDLNENPELAQINFESNEYAISEKSKPAYEKRIDTAVESLQRERANTIEKNEKEQTKLLKQSQNDLEIDFIELMANNELTEAKIIAAGQNRALRPAQVKSLLSDIQNPDKVSSDPAEYTDTLEGVLKGTMSIDKILQNTKLSPVDKKTLTGMITTSENLEEREKEKKIKEDTKRVTAAIKPFIISTGPLAQFVKQDEQILLQSAIQELNERISQGEDPDKIKVDLIQRYNRVPLSVEQLPQLRYGSPENLDLAAQILIQKFKDGQITAIETNRQAKLLEDYRTAIRNQREFEQLKKDSQRSKK